MQSPLFLVRLLFLFLFSFFVFLSLNRSPSFGISFSLQTLTLTLISTLVRTLLFPVFLPSFLPPPDRTPHRPCLPSLCLSLSLSLSRPAVPIYFSSVCHYSHLACSPLRPRCETGRQAGSQRQRILVSIAAIYAVRAASSYASTACSRGRERDDDEIPHLPLIEFARLAWRRLMVCSVPAVACSLFLFWRRSGLWFVLLPVAADGVRHVGGGWWEVLRL
ncbi:hypothetical protein BC567DRAFT_70422 [Phyllosticta citribraziliensis]